MGKQKSAGNRNSSSSSMDCSTTSPDLLCEEDVQCPICLNLLVEPVRMPCSHCLCNTCFTTTLKESTLQCPVCRARIGTFARRSMKADTLVDQVLWKAIQRQFKEKLKLQKMETVERNAFPLTSSLVPSPIVGRTAAPGEIRKEFEQQRKQLQQAHQLADEQVQMAADKQLAARLQAEFNSTPAGAVRRHSLVASPYTPVTLSSSESEGEEGEEEEEDEDASESHKNSARRLFMNMNGKTGRSLKRKSPSSKSAAASKENNVSGQRRKKRSCSKKPHQFAGCAKRPRMAGTTCLNITLETTDDETEVSFKSINTSLNTSTNKVLTPKLHTSPKAAPAKATKRASQTRTDSDQSSIFSATSSRANSRNGSLSSVAGSSSRTSSGYASGSSSVSPQLRGRKRLGLDELQDVALALLEEGPHDLVSTAALVAEQKALEETLKQEVADKKLAQQLQRQFTRLQVDRTQGSGEEYSLRSRDEPDGRARRRTSAGKCKQPRATREASPCY